MENEQSRANRRAQILNMLSSGQAKDAAGLLKADVVANEKDAEAHALLGAALSMTGDTTGGIIHLERAIQIDPNQARYHYNLGSICERAGDAARAIEAYQRTLQLDNNYARAAEALNRLNASSFDLSNQVPQPAVQSLPAAQPAIGAAPGRAPLTGEPVPSPPPSYGPSPAGYSPPGVYPSSPAGYPAPSGYASLPAYAHERGAPKPVYLTHDWKSAPPIVVSARFLNVFVVCLSMLGAIVTGGIALTGGSSQSLDAAVAWVFFLLYAGVAALHIWLARAVKRGTPAAWTVQMILAFIGLLGFPLFTLIYGYLLAFWFRDETKAWFAR